MDKQRQDDQLEPTYNSSVPIQDVALKTCQKQWTIEKGGEKGSVISMLMVRRDDDDDDIQKTTSNLPPGNVSSYTNILNIAYITTYNNTQI